MHRHGPGGGSSYHEADFATQPTSPPTFEGDAKHTLLAAPEPTLARSTFPLFAAGIHEILQRP